MWKLQAEPCFRSKHPARRATLSARSERVFNHGARSDAVGHMPLRVSSSARAAVLRRCRGACEACGLEWPWILYLFRIDEAGPAAASNLHVRCGPCSTGLAGAFAPLLSQPSPRERLREANNRRSGTAKLTPARRRRLIAARGGHCQDCGASGSERQLDVHHRLGIVQGGDDGEDNLLLRLRQLGKEDSCPVSPLPDPAAPARPPAERHLGDEIKARFPSLVRSW